jgi:L-seryl-tRNA(Ser) seleniumtransferase
METSNISDLKQEYLKNLPAIGKLIHHPKIKELTELYSKNFILKIIQKSKDDMRNVILASEEDDLADMDLSTERLINAVSNRIDVICKPSMGHVINATGIILSTNLGRAPLSKAAQEALINTARGYSPLAVDIETGRRGDRDSHLQELITTITGAESATVANNNAAATMLILSSIANGKEVLVSRGQLVEIGGDFQLVEVVHRSGAILVEVGSTNRTHLKNYKEAITENTGAILRVHQSNYRIIGFSEDVPLADLVQLGKEHDIPVIDDLGADVVCFSGDKLLSGPQAGIIIGKKKYIQMIKKNPFSRMLRVGKLTVAALEATFRLYLSEDTITQTNPTLHIITRPLSEVNQKAEALAEMLKNLDNKAIIDIIDGHSQVGGGTLPVENIPTRLVSIKPLSISADALGKRLRKSAPPVFPRIQQDCILLDMRTIFDDEVEMTAGVLEKCFDE